MSDGQGQSDSAQSDTGTDQGQQQGAESSGQVDDGLSSGFLKNIPAEHRGIIEPYVKTWDAGVNRRFQELHNQYEPYKNLGLPVENMQQAAQIYRMLEENPQEIYRLLKEEFDKEDAPGQGAQSELTDQQYAQLPPDLKAQIDLQQQVLETLAQKFLDQETSQSTAREDQEFDSYLTNLKTELGDFDEDYVLAKMLKGMDGEKAVKSYHAAMQKAFNEQSKSAPHVLNGGGPVPSNNVKLGDVPRADLKAFVAEQLRQASQG